jgi:DDB1- and CUL4-associated factor 5
MKHTLKHLYDSQLKFKQNTHAHFYQKQFDNAFNLYSKDLKAHFSCVNAIEFSNKESEHFASGGDDRRVLVWNIDKDVLSANEEKKSSPKTLKSYHQSNISTLAWDNENRRIFSGGNDSQVLVHDTKT